MCLGQLGRHANASEDDIGGFVSVGETSQAQKVKRMSFDLLDFDNMNKVVFAM